MDESPRDPELAELADELTATLSDLRDELDGRREPPRGVFGLPRPPTPRELLRFTDEFTIPTAIAILEANIRMLEAFRGAIRLARAGDEARARGRETRARTEELGRGALDRLDDVLVDLQNAFEGRPEDPETRTLLDDARTLRREIDERLRDTDRRSNGQLNSRDAWGGRRRPREGDAREPRPPHDTATDEEGVAIDVDAELDSIREEVDEDEDDEDNDADI